MLGLNNPEGLQSNKHSASQYTSIAGGGQNYRNPQQQYTSIVGMGGAKESSNAGAVGQLPSSSFLVKTSSA